MANYTAKEIDLLGFTMVGTEDPNDPYPPFSDKKITWKGKIIPFINSIEISRTGTIRIWVTPRNDRGYKKDDPEFKRAMREIRERGIEITGWPEPGDEI